MKFKNKIALSVSLLFALSSQILCGQTSKLFPADSLWVDSVFQTLTLQEKVAQLIMIRVNPDGNKKNFIEINKQIIDYKVGGIAFFKGSPTIQANWINYWQQSASVPILVAIDGEWGVSMRYDSTIVFPRQLTLGAIRNDSLIFELGKVIGKECKRLGIHINFAPVVDINSNPQNPVINSRSFGENKFEVSKRSSLIMAGMQLQGIFACAKHFPGHGDTDTDSHFDLPLINHSKETIDTLDLYPFKKIISDGVKSIMIGHLNIPALDSSKKSISSLSYPIVTGLLKEKLKFNGLVFTDAMDMKGVSILYKPGAADIKALNAGVDIILLPQDLTKTIDSIVNAVEKNKISQDFIDTKCKKVLRYKYYAGLNKYKPVELDHLLEDINNPEDVYLQHQLFEKAITLVKNNNNLLPIIDPVKYSLASIVIGDTVENTFQKMLANYEKIDNYFLQKNTDNLKIDSLINVLKKYDYVIVSIQNTNSLANLKFGVSQKTFDFIDSLRKTKKVILNIFGNPYLLARVTNTDNIESIIVSYQDNEITQRYSAQMLFGADKFEGKLPVTASLEFPLATGIVTQLSGKLKYTLPEELGISTQSLKKVDSLALLGMENKAYPGCQILLAKDGKVFYQKTFGFHTYDNKVPVTTDNIYDLASVTKIAATTLALMKLYDQGKINLNKKIGFYLPELDGSNKENLVIRDILTHQSKLKAWIPFYKTTLKNGQPDTLIYKKVKSSGFSVRVADSLFIRNDYKDTIMQTIIKSPLNKKKEYVYSDLGFYLMRMLVEKISGKNIEDYIAENFYNPLGLSTIGYNPRNRFSLKQIVPTEIDTVFRKQTVYGDVNDQGAAMLGGISGHAGLFSDANDLAVICQMLLQNGEYAGKKYFSAETVKEFTKYQFPEKKNRRGLGFDKPVLDSTETGPTCKEASPESYGHSGFTGTYFWVDPKENLIFIFLSNRVYPDASNKKLIEMGIRTSIQKEVYDIFKNK